MKDYNALDLIRCGAELVTAPSGSVYRKVGLIHYDPATPDWVINVIQAHYNDPIRLRFSYGDQDTGRDWEESYNIEGYVRLSSGKYPIPILIHNTRSVAGPSILTHCVVRIQFARGKSIIGQHPHYHIGEDNGGTLSQSTCG